MRSDDESSHSSRADGVDRPPRVTMREEGGRVMERDVVCGMQVDPAKAAGTSEYNGKTYYFCSKSCKVKFDANPGQYVR